MKRTFLFAAILLICPVADARDDHVRPYTEGIAAAEAGDWQRVIEKMTEAIAHASQEARSIRTRSGPIPYVPHFWLGISYANQEKWSAALRELELSEKHGVIQNTTYYARLRSTKSKIEGRNASNTTSAGIEEAREIADAALKRALSAQGNATTAGAARVAEFRLANQKLQEALSSRREGTIDSLENTASAASEAADLFSKAAAKVSQPSNVKVQRRQAASPVTRTPEPQPVFEVTVPMPETEPVRPVKEPLVPAVEEAARAPESGIDPEERVGDPVQLSAPPADVTPDDPPSARVSAARDIAVVPQASPPPGSSRPREADRRILLADAYRSIASGDLTSSASILSSLVIADPQSIDALVLRGYVRYLQAVLQRDEKMLTAAAGDFKAALRLNPRIRLDERDFSPKAIEFFDQLRGEREE